VTTFVIRRLLASIPSVIGIAVLSFVMLHIVPGSPVQLMLGSHYTVQRAQELEALLGLNKPLYVQFAIWFWNMCHLNFGFSYSYSMPVMNLIWLDLPHTLVIVTTSVLMAFLVSVVLGTAQGYYRNTTFDNVMTVVTYFFYSMPTFWLGIIVVELFAITLGWLPAGGISNPTIAHQTFWQYASHLILPCGTLMVGSVAGYSRYMRSSVLDSLHQDYIRTARAKGLAELGVVFKHALRNSLLPMITLFGLTLPALFGGALFIEEIFNYPGMGILFWNAALTRDYPVMLGIVMLLGIVTILGNLVADLVYGIADPRIQYN